MKRGNKTLAIALSMALALTSIAAGSPVKSAAKAKIKLNKKKVTLTVGKAVKLKVLGTKKKVKWSSSNESVAIVVGKKNGVGRVISRKAGKAKITAKVMKKKYTCQVTVKKKKSKVKVTVEPTATATPTKTPVVTKAPAITPIPNKSTAAPNQGPNNTATRKPSVTKKPRKTMTPQDPDNPENPDDPEEPVVTRKPTKTKAPVDPIDPDEPEEPDEPDDPVVTRKPTKTKAPVEVDPEEPDEPITTRKPQVTASPVKPATVYKFVGKVTGWGGPDTYPSSQGHEAGDGLTNVLDDSQSNIKASSSYNCGVEFMNPYNSYFTGESDELAQIIKGMSDPVVRVTLENGGTASVYNWKSELSCPSGEEVALTKEFLVNKFLCFFGNDDTITKIEFYDRAGGSVDPSEPTDPTDPDEPTDPIDPEEPGDDDSDSSQLAKNIDIKMQKLPSGDVLIQTTNNNKETIKWLDVSYSLCDSEGTEIAWDSYDVYNMAPGAAAYDVISYEDAEGFSASQSTVDVDVYQYTPDEKPELTQSYKKSSDGTMTFTVKNNSSKDVRIYKMFVFYKDAEGNIVAAKRVYSDDVKAGGTAIVSADAPVYQEAYDGHKAGETIDYASGEIYFSSYGYLNDDEDGDEE